MDTFRSILQNEGPRGFYRGLGVNLIRTVPSNAITILTCVSFDLLVLFRLSCFGLLDCLLA
jgi:hypothetical protein